VKVQTLRKIGLRRQALAAERALHNFLVESFAKPFISRQQRYCARSAAELTREVPIDKLAMTVAGHATVHGSAVTCLPAAQFLNTDRAGTPGRPTSTTSPPLVLSRLSDGLCMPDQIVLAHDQALSDSAAEWSIVDVSFTSAIDLGNHREIAQVSDDCFRLKRSVARVERLPGPYLYLDCQHRTHFGHFLVDVMSMTWAYQVAERHGFRPLKVLINAKVAPFMITLLETMGISRAAMVPVHRPVRCEQLLVATKSFLTLEYTSPTAIATWQQMRDALDSGRGPELIYFSRSQNRNRPLTNEAAVEDVFASRGFRIIHPERLPIREQVSLWANARLVAGTSGSNMFGLAFQRRLQRSLLINSPNLMQGSELMLQAGYGSETSLYIGRVEGTDPHAPWSVEIADLRRAVDRWMG
jgi:capsular polysaccharide biosynthesis protein